MIYLDKKSTKDETVKISMRISKSKLEYLMYQYGTNGITDVFSKLIDDKLENDFKSDATRSVITSIGAKNKLASRIIDLIPEHKVYIEPFGNTASVLLKKARSFKEVYNDIDNNVTNFFMVLRDNPLGLYNACATLPYSEKLYYDLLYSSVPDNPLEKAVRFFYLNRCGFLGTNAIGFRSFNGKRNYSKFYYSECERFFAVSKRFEDVEITNKDYKKIITKFKEDEAAFFFCDPPYFDGTNYYDNSFNLKSWSTLAHLLSSIKGKAMICNCKNYQIHKLFTGLGYRTVRIRTHYVSANYHEEDGTIRRPLIYLYLYLNY